MQKSPELVARVVGLVHVASGAQVVVVAFHALPPDAFDALPAASVAALVGVLHA